MGGGGWGGRGRADQVSNRSHLDMCVLIFNSHCILCANIFYHMFALPYVGNIDLGFLLLYKRIQEVFLLLQWL